MKCPACGNDLQKITVKDITVDACKGGCGGIWFDQFELKKVDEPHESAGESLLDIERNENLSSDRSKRRMCPKCEGIVMMQHFVSIKREVEVDECPKCAGFWLDYGELGRIRNQFESEADRKKAAAEYFSEIVDKDLARMRQESKEKSEKSQKIARMFRFVCPSYYIPGKQDWGAF